MDGEAIDSTGKLLQDVTVTSAWCGDVSRNFEDGGGLFSLWKICEVDHNWYSQYTMGKRVGSVCLSVPCSINDLPGIIKRREASPAACKDI